MKLVWESFKEGENFISADCGPISLDVDKNENGDWIFYVDETGDEGFETYESQNEAMKAAEAFAQEFANSIINGIKTIPKVNEKANRTPMQFGGIDIEVILNDDPESMYPGGWFFSIAELGYEETENMYNSAQEALEAACRYAEAQARLILDIFKDK